MQRTIDPTWNAFAGDCDECGEELAFMEGPICDGCLDEQERDGTSSPITHNEDEELGATFIAPVRRGARPEQLAGDEDDAPPTLRNITARPRLVVDLEQRRVTFCKGAA